MAKKLIASSAAATVVFFFLLLILLVCIILFYSRAWSELQYSLSTIRSEFGSVLLLLQ
jgi:hypothetical protein